MINTYKGWLFKLFCMHVLIAVESFVIGFSYNCGVCFQIQNVEKWKVLQLRGQRLVWRKSTRNNGVFLCWAESSAPWEGRLAVCGNVGINPLSVFKFLGFMPAMYQIGWEAGLQDNWDIDVGRSLLKWKCLLYFILWSEWNVLDVEGLKYLYWWSESMKKVKIWKDIYEFKEIFALRSANYLGSRLSILKCLMQFVPPTMIIFLHSILFCL